MTTQTATFGAGCFWGVEYVFERVPGVLQTEVGYAGGHTENPTYRDVCSHGTGHAEVLGVEFDLVRIGRHADLGPVTLEQLLATWTVHDLNHQTQIAKTLAKRYREEVGPWRANLPIVDLP